MLPTSKGVIRFTPPDLEGTEKPPVYLIGIPSVAGRAEFRRALAGAGMRYWGEEQFSAEARKFLEEIKPDNLAELLATIDGIGAIKAPAPLLEGQVETEEAAQERARLSKEAAEARTKWAELVEVLSQQAPRIAKMTGDNLHYTTLSPFVSVAMFLRGWENIDLTFKRLSDGTVPHDLLEELPPGHIGQIWAAINDAMQPNRMQEKNSASPSRPADTITSQPAASDHPTADNSTSAEISTN